MTGKLTDEQIEDVLKTNMIGRIGCTADGMTYIVPTNYIYDGKHLICHALAGMKIKMMRKNPQVCFEVDEIKNFTNWKSVVIQGTYQELTAEPERYAAMKLFVDRTLRLKISETAILPERTEKRVHPRSPGNIKPVIYRIIIFGKSGRFEND